MNRARPWALYAGNTPRPAVPGKEQKEKTMKTQVENMISHNGNAIPNQHATKTGKKTNKMTASELKYRVETAGHESHFFTRATMRFFGDRMANYGVRDAGEVKTNSGDTVPAWELYRRRAVKHGLQASAYFNKDTFARVFPAQA